MSVIEETADAEQRLKELGIDRPQPPKPLGAYVANSADGEPVVPQRYIAGGKRGKPKYVCRIGDELSVEDGQRAAQLAALNALALAKEHLGSAE